MGNYTDVLKRLVLYRKLLGLTQNELASKVGINQELYSYIEKGHVLISGPLLIRFDSIGLNTDSLIAKKTPTQWQTTSCCSRLSAIHGTTSQ